MTDRLAGLLQHYALRARVFHSGSLCGSKLYDDDSGHIHLLRAGTVDVSSPAHGPLHLERPSLLFYPRPTPHRIDAGAGAGVPVDLLCAMVELGSAAGNPLAQALPLVSVLDLSELPQLTHLLEMLFDEAGGNHCGRQVAIDRLCELVLIHLLRELMDRGSTNAGLLAGLADPRLARALSAIHEAPGRPWSLTSLASLAGMSRARFASAFRDQIGCTPGHYLAHWRVQVACNLLRRGRPVGHIADEVGYGSAQALARAFRTHLGYSPSVWLRQQMPA
ncbi:MAG: AraC family transcriptional regulator [Rhodocyclaceae bacterium]|nr:AraC family transcriptional regulator [Rhodocyclaceae bacterium]